MPLRKSHAKSHFGCLPCKKRHIKCGEESPSCRNCQKRHVDCVYKPSQTSTNHNSRGSSSDTRSQTITRTADEETSPLTCVYDHTFVTQLPINIARVQELHLMTHYINYTCETMSHGTDDIHIWQKVVPDEAMQHPFLLDGLLALSSLHFAWQNPTSCLRYTEIAVGYQAPALEGYKHALESVTSNNRCALFAFSMILNILALGFPNVCQGPSHSPHVESVIALSELLYGMRFIMLAPDGFLGLEKFSPLFGPFRQKFEPPKPSDDVVSALSRLRARVDSIQYRTDTGRHQACLSGVKSLEEMFGHFNRDPKYLGYIMAWPATVSKKLIALLKKEDPMAQLIFVHYGALLLHTRSRWWGQNTGYRLIEGLSRSVCDNNPEWADLTEWARSIAALAAQDDAGC